MQLQKPSLAHLESYKAALTKGWSPDNLRPERAQEELALIDQDAAAFIDSRETLDPQGATVTLPDGSSAPRLPWFCRWMWDGEFCGSISLRWQHGTNALPEHVLGHIGYSVVAWKQRKGYATRALGQILEEAKKIGLSYVYLTSSPDNIPSHKVIFANGGFLEKRFTPPPAYGTEEKLLFRINTHKRG